MTKNWIKYYLLLGSMVMIAISLLCSFAFVRTNILQAQDKNVFESIYEDTSIDFIVPSPSYSQVREIEENPDTGVAVFAPYYETSSSAMINGNAAKGSVLLLADESKVNSTPYGAARIIDGEPQSKSGSAMIDRVYAEKNGCKLGDAVSMSLGGHSFEFEVTGITEANTYYDDGTIALVLSLEQVSQLEADGITYSAAYVSASDYDKCKTYLYNEYKPYGRLKSEDEFDSKEVYEQHVQNFNEANWSKEITNVKDNYSSLSVKYENVDTSIYRNMIIGVVIVVLAVILFNAILLRNGNLNSFFRSFLIKKSGTKAEIKSFYTRGILFNILIFVVCTAAVYWWLSTSIGVKPLGANAITSGGLIVAQIIASIIMLIAAGGYVEKNYTIKKKPVESQMPAEAKETEKEVTEGEVEASSVSQEQAVLQKTEGTAASEMIKERTDSE